MLILKYCGVGFLVLGLAAPSPLLAQKRKKGDDVLISSAALAREAEFYFTEGEKYFILEDYAKALVFYQKTLELAPENATVHYKIADVLNRSTKEEDLQKAARSIEQAISLEKKNKYFYLLAANIYNGLSQFDKAAECYAQLIHEVPSTEEYLFELGATYQYANRYEDAIKAYTQAEVALGINEMSCIQKVRLYLELNKTKDALMEAEKLISLDPEEGRYAMSLAELFSQRGDKTNAILFLENFLKTHADDHGQERMMLAGLYRETKRHKESEELLLQVFDDETIDFGSKALIVATLNAELNQEKSTGVLDPEKEKLAFTLYEKVAKQHPTEGQLYILGGDLYLTTGNSQKAMEEYEKAIALGDVNIEVWQNLLYIEAQKEELDDIIKHAEQALELFPNHAMLHYFHGYAKFRKRQFKESVQSLEQAKVLSASNPAFVSDLNSMLGDAYNSLKDYPKSDKAYEEALSYNPNNDAVLNNYSFYLSLRKENLEKAEKMASQLIKDHPDNATYLDTYAWVLYSREKYKEAKKIIERALTNETTNATHLEHYGDILFKLGDINGAVLQWQKARELNTNSEILNKKIANRKIYE